MKAAPVRRSRVDRLVTSLRRELIVLPPVAGRVRVEETSSVPRAGRMVLAADCYPGRSVAP